MFIVNLSFRELFNEPKLHCCKAFKNSSYIYIYIYTNHRILEHTNLICWPHSHQKFQRNSRLLVQTQFESYLWSCTLLNHGNASLLFSHLKNIRVFFIGRLSLTNNFLHFLTNERNYYRIKKRRSYPKKKRNYLENKLFLNCYVCYN